MSTRSQEEVVGITDRLICLREACLANLRAMSDSCAELLTLAGCGRQQYEPCASFDPESRSMRTRQLSLFSNKDEPLTELCQKWSRSGMICGGTYFPLPRLVQGISASDSSSSLPTPTASRTANIENPETAIARAEKRPNLACPAGQSLGVTVRSKLLPTPTAKEDNKSPEAHLAMKERMGSGRKTITSLRVWSKQLPTPTANDGRKRGNNAYWKDQRSQTTFDDNLPRALFGKLLPTPKAQFPRPDFEKDNRNSHGEDLVTRVAKLLPTPNARDYKDTSGSVRNDPDHHHGCDQLPRAIFAAESASPDQTAKIGGARLSPEFLCWLMGFPTNWLKPLVDAPVTRWSRKPSSRSSQPSET